MAAGGARGGLRGGAEPLAAREALRGELRARGSHGLPGTGVLLSPRQQRLGIQLEPEEAGRKAKAAIRCWVSSTNLLVFPFTDECGTEGKHTSKIAFLCRHV